MQEKHNEATPQRPQGDRPLDAPLVLIDLPAIHKQIKGEASWSDSDRNAITVFKSAGLRIVLVALHEGAEMKKHLAGGILNVQVLDGQITFNTEAQSVILNKGQMLILHEGIAHSVTANLESTFLLTIAVSNKQ